MIRAVGDLRKMKASPGQATTMPDAELSAGGAERTVAYTFICGGETVALNPLLGQKLELDFSGRIHCVACGRSTKKSFNQGYCFPCMRKLAACDLCIQSPERCHFQEGTCREPDWGLEHCFVPHIVYLANSSGPKVGITRRTQMPVRWLDQGATQALPMYEVSSRRLSGMIEAVLRSRVSDRTQWQRMLKGSPEPLDLKAQAHTLLSALEPEVDAMLQREGALLLEDALVTRLSIRQRPSLNRMDAEQQDFQYPVQQYPARIKSLNPEKDSRIEGTLLGIKGQYLILDSGVLNIRKYTAYEATLTIT